MAAEMERISRTVRDTYDEAGRRAGQSELIDGVPYDLPSPTLLHQILAYETGRELSRCSDESGHSVVLPVPIEVRLDRDTRTAVLPDIAVVCRKEQIRDHFVFGAPDLIAEILSPETAYKDRFLKLMKYMNAGVREYWIVDPLSGTVMVYEKDAAVVPMTYTFDDDVPVGIWNRTCGVGFRGIRERIAGLPLSVSLA